MEDCEKTFNNLKTLLTKAPILVHPDFSREFHLETDALGAWLGAVLVQQLEGESPWPIAYASRTLQAHE